MTTAQRHGELLAHALQLLSDAGNVCASSERRKQSSDLAIVQQLYCAHVICAMRLEAVLESSGHAHAIAPLQLQATHFVAMMEERRDDHNESAESEDAEPA